MSDLDTVLAWMDIYGQMYFDEAHQAIVRRASYELAQLRKRIEQDQRKASEVEEILREMDRVATHWEGCESEHPICKALKVLAEMKGG